MIQRIQTIYLLIVAAVSGGLIFVFDLWAVNNAKVFAIDLFASESILEKLIPISFIAVAVLALITIFKYKNRQLQFVLGRIIILINLFLLGILIYRSVNLPGEELTSEKGIGMFIPTVAILFSVMANKAIKKDEDLVKSSERIR